MNSKKTVYAGLFLALGLLLPMIFHQFSMGGQVFLPMHIPVFLAGLSLGPVYGLIIGVLTPALSSVLTGMPPFPVVVTMVGELAMYGFLSGYLYKNKGLNVFLALLISMIGGRVISALILYILSFNIAGIEFISFPIYLSGNIITGLPGILIQFVLIPILVRAVESYISKNSIE